MKRKIYHGFAVDNGVDPVKLMNARKDVWFQAMLIWLCAKEM